MSMPAAVAMPAWVRANRRFGRERLNFERYLMRHGRRTANHRDRIVSDSTSGRNLRRDLPPVGRQQAREGALEALQAKILDGSVGVYCLPFTRA